MTECNAIIKANNEIDKLKRENEKLNELCVQYGFEMGRLEEENEQLKEKNQKNIQFVFDTIETYSDDCFHHNEGGWSYMLNELIEDIKNGIGWK